MSTAPFPVLSLPLPDVSETPAAPRSFWRRYLRLTTVTFSMVHVAAIVGAVVYWSWGGVALAFASYFVRMIVVTMAYHRYFSHRAFKTSRPMQFLLALAAQTAGQKGVIWWASHHRWHHKHSDTPRDLHSAKLSGFWYAHIGWVLSENWNETDQSGVKDLLKFPELRALNTTGVALLPIALLGLAFLLIGGPSALVWGFLVSSVMLWHGSFSVNSLAHLFGRRRYQTSDDSRNCWWLAIFTTGEGWHNNHHHYPSSARQGFRWWEIDITYYVLWLLERTGLVWDLRQPPRAASAASDTADAPYATLDGA
jgi:stearoyl-CoA desaturase (Delta-9 desaturase)